MEVRRSWIGYQYTISAPDGFMFAYGGGGRVATRVEHKNSGICAIGPSAITTYSARPAPFDNDWQKFRLIQQSDSSYALQTSNGINYVTAIRGGGLPSGTLAYDDLVTDRTQVSLGTFRFVDQGNCTYAIQTNSGNYVGKTRAAPGTVLGVFSTDVSDIKDAIKFRLVMTIPPLP